jgi:hypothetical protein
MLAGMDGHSRNSGGRFIPGFSLISRRVFQSKGACEPTSGKNFTTRLIAGERGRTGS